MERTIVVTGASSGVGLAAAEQFAALGDQVVVVGRNPDRLAAAVDRVRAAGRAASRAVPGRFRARSTRSATLAAHLLDRYPTIDVLANNAGGMVGEYRRTVDGYEATIQGNHLARSCSPTCCASGCAAAGWSTPPPRRTARARPTRTTSPATRRSTARGRRTARQGREHPLRRRGRPPLAGRAQRVVPPGRGAHQLRRRRGDRFFYRYAPFLVTPEKAGALLVWLATAPAAELIDGGYYVGRQTGQPAPCAPRIRHAAATAVGGERQDGRRVADGP